MEKKMKVKLLANLSSKVKDLPEPSCEAADVLETYDTRTIRPGPHRTPEMNRYLNRRPGAAWPE